MINRTVRLFLFIYSFLFWKKEDTSPIDNAMSLAIYIDYVLCAKMVIIIHINLVKRAGQSVGVCTILQLMMIWIWIWIWVYVYWEFTWQLSHGGWFSCWILYVETNNWQQLHGGFVFEPLYVHDFGHRLLLQLLVILYYCYFHTVEMSVYPIRAFWMHHKQHSIITCQNRDKKEIPRILICHSIIFPESLSFDDSNTKITNSHITTVQIFIDFSSISLC